MLMVHPHPELQFTHPLPYGAILHDGGVQFVVFSRSATAMRVLLYDNVDDREPAEIIDFDPDLNRWGDIWSIFVPGIGPGQLYHFQADGPYDPKRGQSFRPPGPADRPVRQGPGGRLPAGRRRHHPPAEVRGHRRRVRLAGRPPPAPRPVRDDHLRDARPRLHASRRPAACKHPGTYLGVIEKIPYLQVAGRDGRRTDAGPRVPHHRLLRQHARAAELLGLRSAGASSRRTAATPPATSRAARSASSRRWSARCTRRASR